MKTKSMTIDQRTSTPQTRQFREICATMSCRRALQLGGRILLLSLLLLYIATKLTATATADESSGMPLPSVRTANDQALG